MQLVSEFWPKIICYPCSTLFKALNLSIQLLAKAFGGNSIAPRELRFITTIVTQWDHTPTMHLSMALFNFVSEDCIKSLDVIMHCKDGRIRNQTTNTIRFNDSTVQLTVCFSALDSACSNSMLTRNTAANASRKKVNMHNTMQEVLY